MDASAYRSARPASTCRGPIRAESVPLAVDCDRSELNAAAKLNLVQRVPVVSCVVVQPFADELGRCDGALLRGLLGAAGGATGHGRAIGEVIEDVVHPEAKVPRRPIIRAEAHRGDADV